MLRHHPPESDGPQPSARQVFATGLRLKPHDRVSLARRLLASVERDPVADHADAFDAMLLRRFEDLRSGAVEGHSAEESLAIVRRGMRRKR
jgi:hypothetical protein